MARYFEDGLTSLYTFTSTIAVGSTYYSSVLNLLPYPYLVGICKTTSSDIVVAFDQGGTSGTWDTSSTVGVAATTKVLDWKAYAEFGRVGISTVNSSVGELISLYVYGKGITQRKLR